MAWNYNMDQAPKGRTVIETRRGKDGPVQVERFVRDIVIASRGDCVTMSYWIPKEGRWCMFTKDAPPIAWQPWPEPAEAAL